MLGLVPLFLLTGWSALTVVSTNEDSKLIYPIIPNAGGVVALPNGVDQPRVGAKVVLDVTVDTPPQELNKGIKKAALLLNLYGAAGRKASDVNLTVILHGKATRCVLTDAAYQAKLGVAQNPNLPIMKALQQAGVEVLVCGQALNYSHFAADEVIKQVPIAQSALTVVIHRQMDGYAYVPVP